MKKNLLIAIVIASPLVSFSQWIQQQVSFTSPSFFADMEVTTQLNAWANIYTLTGTSVEPTSTFAYTRDGGSSWIIDTLNGPPAAYLISNIYPLDQDTAYAALYEDPTGGGIYKTIDGGETWTRVGPSNMFDGNSFPNFVYFFDIANGIAIGDPNPTGHFEVWWTDDYGNNWTRVQQSDIPASAVNEFGIVNLFSAVGNNIWFGTDLGNVYKSSDRGQTWTVAPTNMIVSTQTITDMAFVDTVNGFCTQNELLYVTSDGGQTWTDQPYTGTMFQFDIEPVPNAVTLVSSGTSATGAGTSYSQDLGQSWITLDTGIEHTAIDFLDELTGWSGEVATGLGGAYLYNGAALSVDNPKVNSNVIMVYPNPSDGIINIQLADLNEDLEVKVYGSQGNLLFDTSFRKHNGRTKQIDLSHFDKGLYTIVFDGRTTHEVKKVVFE